jgi:GTP-binding protein YchF
MSLTAGIVGLPNVGKSTLFNAITKKNILAANYPFATIDPNLGIVTVPDKRLEQLEKMYVPESLVATTFEFTDIAGLVRGASTGEGLGNKFLSHIREVDAICEVVRCFKDESIIHVEDGVDPIRDIEIVNVELMIADLEVINNRIDKIGKKALNANEKEAVKEFNALQKAQNSLEKNIPLRMLEYTEEEYNILKTYNLLTIKPIIYVANVSESEITNNNNEYVELVEDYASKEKAKVVIICARMESELSELNDEDKYLYLKELGIEQSGLDKLIQATYSLLGLATFFTAGPKEVRAWTFKKGMTAKQCAGIIHSDIERGFIKAEIFSYDDLIRYGNEKEVKENGKLRIEGKEYLIQDGDICYFRFNV